MSSMVDMYKKMSLADLLTVQTTLFDRLVALCTYYKHQYLKGLLKEVVADSERVYFLQQNKPTLGFYPERSGGLRLTDEIEHIELQLSPEEVEQLHNLLKDKGVMKQVSKNATVFEDLLRQFQEKDLTTFLEKPFLVYDIETTFDKRGGGQEFALAYCIDSSEDQSERLLYRYIDRDGLTKFAQFLLDYDGRIIGFNQLSFDNPITMQQAGLDEQALATVQAKSLDPFQLIRGLTGRRMSLQAMATALIGAGKTLSSGAEGQDLLDKWFQNGDTRALEKVKTYCKNDVEITLGVFLYMIHYQEIHLDGKHLILNDAAFLAHATYDKQKDEGEYTNISDSQKGLF